MTGTSITIRLMPQRGSALIIGLIFLMLLTLLGVAAMQGSALQERMAGNLRDRGLAFQAAEAALREAERLLQRSGLPSFDQPERGLSQPRHNALRDSYWSLPPGRACPPPDDASALHHCWERDFAELGDNGDDGPEGLAGAVSQLPRYFIEEMPPDPQSDIRMFRMTARGVGGRGTSVVILQSTYAADSLARKSWRQIR